MQTSLISKLTPQPKYALHTTGRAPLRGSGKRWMDGDDDGREKVSSGYGEKESERGESERGSGSWK